MSGGGGLKKVALNYILDKPVNVYIGGGFFLWGLRKYQTATTYNYFFGKQDYQRRLERGQLH